MIHLFFNVCLLSCLVDRWCVMLKNDDGSLGYLHAVQASGYKQQRAFIIAQTPLPASLHTLWKVIYDRKLSVIVQLTALVEEGKEVCTAYWPGEMGEVASYQGYSVDLINEEHLSGLTVRTLSVLEQKVSCSCERELAVMDLMVEYNNGQEGAAIAQDLNTKPLALLLCPRGERVPGCYGYLIKWM